MPSYQSETEFPSEPQRRFYPNQDLPLPPYKKDDDAAYLAHRHPVLLQRLYETADTLLKTYPRHGFIYDAYPDALSLQLMRDRLLRENASLTESFLQAGCPIAWLNLLTDTVLSDLLFRLRQSYRSPKGVAKTTSVQSVSRL